MPILVDAELRAIGQEEFGRMAYEVMAHAFQIQDEFGRFFDESIYRNELAHRVPSSRREVTIEVSYEDFRKLYYLDLLVDGAGAFELKAVEKLHDRHRAQVMNYLHLTELSHAKLINMRPHAVEHEFVNVALSRLQRTQFDVRRRDWREPLGCAEPLRPWLEAVIRDWGTGLDLRLYEEAAWHRFGGGSAILTEAQVVFEGRNVGTQKIRCAGDGGALKVTTLGDDALGRFEQHARKLMLHMKLPAIYWINVTHDNLTFQTLLPRST